ncbi:GNAT family N-acetyltransferase [Clostridium estertheticum]|uniref:GNAT family N-acetyltransferase n=1 Tax=Clostridium estertheticum TaxID=238834 RepID=UPI0013E93694|nr:GNAT family N-acetyltransferase [Clostridium estertheticum]MBZ9687400.1 GNAT family N-acetyltransferase [Clostridium estertheticum]
MSKMNFEFDNFPQLESERFILREVKEQDYISLYEIYSDEDAVKYQPICTMNTIEQAEKSVQAFLQGFKNKKFIRWCIATKENDTVVGLITLHDFNICNSQAEIGFMLNKKYWRQNTMGEVSPEIIKFAFEIIGLNRIEALIHPDNIASIKLSEKLGFLREGFKKESAYNKRTDEYEDRLIFGITKNNIK